jgi:hypothetical protein
MSILKEELDNDPLVRGYSVMTDQEAADDLNTVYRTRARNTMLHSELADNIDQGEYGALATDEKNQVHQILQLGGAEVTVGPGSFVRDRFIAIFGGGSTTVSNLGSAAIEDISRANELGLSFVTGAAVQRARAL